MRDPFQSHRGDSPDNKTLQDQANAFISVSKVSATMSDFFTTVKRNRVWTVRPVAKSEFQLKVQRLSCLLNPPPSP
eukprot:2443463-Pyramimonas_sp.AAC.2